MISTDMKEYVGTGKKVTFTNYHDGNLWYECDNGFKFPVPIEDTGSASFPASENAMMFMRWIRKHVKLCVDSQS